MATMETQRKELTPVQKKFADEYLLDPSSGGAAYMRASGSQNMKSCSVQASKLLSLQKMQDYLKDKARSYLGVMEARILQNVEFWINIRDGELPGSGLGPMVPIREILSILQEHDHDEKSPLYQDISDIKVHLVPMIKVAERMKSSEYLGKYMTMFTEKKEISIESQVQIVDNI